MILVKYISKKRIKVYRQQSDIDCGPTCLKIIAAYYGKQVSLEHLKFVTKQSHEGVTLFNLSQGAECIGLECLRVKLKIAQMRSFNIAPCILFLLKGHFIVLPPQRIRLKKTFKLKIIDPARGLIFISITELINNWLDPITQKGITLLFRKSSTSSF